MLLGIIEQDRLFLNYSRLQSIGTPGGTPILMRSVLYYIVMNFEAFIYCFAGEYLNVKVSAEKPVNDFK